MLGPWMSQLKIVGDFEATCHTMLSTTIKNSRWRNLRAPQLLWRLVVDQHSDTSCTICQKSALLFHFFSATLKCVVCRHTLLECQAVHICSDFFQLSHFPPVSFSISPWPRSHSAAEADNKLRSHRTVCSPSGFSHGGRRTPRQEGEEGELRGGRGNLGHAWSHNDGIMHQHNLCCSTE